MREWFAVPSHGFPVAGSFPSRVLPGARRLPKTSPRHMAFAMRDAIKERAGKLTNLTGLNISEVFYGLGGFHEILWTAGLRPQLVNSFEVVPLSENIHQAVDKVRGSSVSTSVKFGAVHGDVMKVRVGTFERSRALVGGLLAGHGHLSVRGGRSVTRVSRATTR